LDEIGGTIAARELHKAKAIPVRIEAQSLGINGDNRAKIVIVRQIAAMKPDGHGVG